jgi:predicted nucleic acid-binding protein
MLGVDRSGTNDADVQRADDRLHREEDPRALSIAIDTNVLVRPLVRDDEAQFQAALRLIDLAASTDQRVLITHCALLETEWVLRSRYRLDKSNIPRALVRRTPDITLS